MWLHLYRRGLRHNITHFKEKFQFPPWLETKLAWILDLQQQIFTILNTSNVQELEEKKRGRLQFWAPFLLFFFLLGLCASFAIIIGIILFHWSYQNSCRYLRNRYTKESPVERQSSSSAMKSTMRIKPGSAKMSLEFPSPSSKRHAFHFTVTFIPFRFLLIWLFSSY